MAALPERRSLEERDDLAYPAAGRAAAVTLQWPPAPPGHLTGYQPWEQPEHARDDEHADSAGFVLPDPPRARLSDPRLIGGIADITGMVGTQLDDGASPAEVMPVIRDGARRWLEGQVRAGLLPATAGGALDELAKAVHDQRYELGPLSAYLRDPQVENVDVNGCDQELPDSPTHPHRYASLSSTAAERVELAYRE